MTEIDNSINPITVFAIVIGVVVVIWFVTIGFPKVGGMIFQGAV